MPLRVVFMGTPAFAVGSLEAIAAAGHEIVAVYTQPPRPGGRRGLEKVKSPVHLCAEQLDMPIRSPKSLKTDEELAIFAALDADVAIVVAYGLLLPAAVLNAPKLGCFNGHASWLPRWRGAAPIQRAIMAGDRTTGMMVMKMDEGLDTGPIALTSTIAIGENMTAGMLHDLLAIECRELLVEALRRLEAGSLRLKPQPETGATYARKIDKSETRIDWTRTANDVHNQIRGLSPFPGAWCELPIHGKLVRTKVLESRLAGAQGKPGEVLSTEMEIGCGTGSVRLKTLQKAGSKPMDVKTFIVGNPVNVGAILDR